MAAELTGRQRLELGLITEGDFDPERDGLLDGGEAEQTAAVMAEVVATKVALIRYLAAEQISAEHFTPGDLRTLRAAWELARRMSSPPAAPLDESDRAAFAAAGRE